MRGNRTSLRQVFTNRQQEDFIIVIAFFWPSYLKLVPFVSPKVHFDFQGVKLAACSFPMHFELSLFLSAKHNDNKKGGVGIANI